jgi:radical SAM protein with 4Fe4S-binding SPASM domain
MNQIQAIDLREKKRIDLGAEAPLPSPLSLYIDTVSTCNLQCNFCPTGDKDLRQLRPNGIMSLDIVRKLIGDLILADIRLKRISLYKDGEPLINKYLPEMVSLLKQSGRVEQLWLKTNGILLTPDLSERLVAAGLDFIGVSVNHVTPEGYQKITKTKVNYQRLIDNVKALYEQRGACKVYVKIADSGLAEYEKKKFYADFGAIADAVSVEGLHGWSDSDSHDWTLGTNAPTFEGYKPTQKIACPLPFFMMAINWNGTVSICNEDWAHKTVVGDIKTQTLREIWEGDKMREFRVMHLKGQRGDNQMCRSCSYMETLPDNLDDSRIQILGRIINASRG